MAKATPRPDHYSAFYSGKFYEAHHSDIALISAYKTVKVAKKYLDFYSTVSSEVAEHIDPCDTDVFVDNLTSFSDVVLFSAAILGQGGTHHVNEQWPSYWIEKFAARGFIPVDCIRPEIWDDDTMCPDYRQNLMLFVRKTQLANYPANSAEAGRKVLNLVHPGIYMQKIDAATPSKMGTRALCKMIPSAIISLIPSLIRSIKKRIRA